ncbi:MAG: heme ABC transporter permease [Candidatus Oxydemutatoraceae bacterium WSBS_2016_MAG_OTU14]
MNILVSLPHWYRWSSALLPWLSTLLVVGIAAGLYWGLVVAPPDYQQGEAYRIIYIHVPAAWMSLFIYVNMAISGMVALTWRTKIAEIICVESAPIGAAFTALALLTGMLWGKPMWGAYWVWDARLTSELILLFLYFGVMALHGSIIDIRKAARAASLLAIVGVINVPIIHYSVEWWSTLHQGPTVTRFDRPAAHSSMLWPLLFMSVMFMLNYLTALCARLRNAIVSRERERDWFKREAGE